jgi:hypothetical protein
MNDKTQEALVALSEKLGTTTEYLWTILVHQARYDIITSVIQMIIMFLIVYWTIKLHIKFYKSDAYYKDSVVFAMIFAGGLSIIMIIFFLNGFNELVSAIFNPEFWALNRILHILN